MKDNMLCTKTHEYVLEENGNYEIGITDYAIEQLEPSIITKYLIEVVNKFNVFYKSYEVLNLEDIVSIVSFFSIT